MLPLLQIEATALGRDFCLCVFWHGLASGAAFASSCYLLSILSKDQPGFQQAIRQYHEELEGL
jgi:hypothetical protein